ncbi:hypothetical protein C1645_750995 [Glomus cerebriforme]|uniref:Uncharacterized protein n=1 Tax=Glomus cerebriforme TaxID=658196 RepID=A0A397TNC9_9GLOM|nr:hypothetical protein C1645_750995 [Glomus cerebriforme]
MNRFLVYIPLLIIIIVVIAIALPITYIKINGNNNNGGNTFSINGNNQNSTMHNPMSIWIWTLMFIFVASILGMLLSACLNHKSKVNQFRAFTKTLNEFNVNDNPRGINWKIDTENGYIDILRYNHGYGYNSYYSYRNSRTMYAQKVSLSNFLKNHFKYNLVTISF